ncbi:unnamed protein product [Arabidopsis halleri]
MKKMNVVAFVMLIISLLLLSQALAELSSSSNNETSSVSQIQTNDENQTAAFKRTYHYHHRPRINCGHACARRCSKTSRKKVCHRACGSCCAKCQCVPPGTSGNTAACPCYANIRTHGNKLKCP